MDGSDAPVSAEWLRCRPWIEAAVKRGGGLYTLADVEAKIAAGEAQFWPGQRCAAVTEVIDYPQARVLAFWLLGGDLNELVGQMRPVIEATAKAIGCTRTQGIFGAKRRGWQRVLEGHGYHPTATILSKEL